LLIGAGIKGKQKNVFIFLVVFHIFVGQMLHSIIVISSILLFIEIIRFISSLMYSIISIGQG